MANEHPQPNISHVEGLAYQQQSRIYGTAFGHPFLSSSPPPRISKTNNQGFGGTYDNLETTIKNSLSVLTDDDQTWEKKALLRGHEDLPKESIVSKPTRSQTLPTLPSHNEHNNNIYPTTNVSASTPSPWPSTTFSSNLSSVQTHALNNTEGYFPPQLQTPDQYTNYSNGLFGPSIRRSVNNIQGNGIIHDDTGHAKFETGLGGPLDYYDPNTSNSAVTPSSPTGHFPQSQQMSYQFRSFENALRQSQPQSQQSQQLQSQQLQSQQLQSQHQQLQYQQIQLHLFQQQQQLLQHQQQHQLQKQQQLKQKQQTQLDPIFHLPSWSTSVTPESSQRHRLNGNGGIMADDVVTGSMALYDPNSDDIMIQPRDNGKLISGNDGKDFNQVDLKLDIRGLQTPIMTAPPGLEYLSPTSPRSDPTEQYFSPTLVAGLTSPTLSSVNSNQNIFGSDITGNGTSQSITNLANSLNNISINSSIEICKETSSDITNVQTSGQSTSDNQQTRSWATIAKNAKPPPVNTSQEVLGTVSGAYSAISPTSAVSPTSAYARPMSAPAGVWPGKNKIAGTPTGNVISNMFPSNPMVPTSASGTNKKDMSFWITATGYNPKTFNCKPPHARFFVIKSYTEDDVHKSLKYNIWASTEIGNRRLDKAFRDSADKGPIYLFFSVNASGHFCGMAEMLTPVDYTTSSSVWQQDKWKGVFKVKWIFVKDIPNGQLRHIRVVNNENKPVTNSRDTQELYPEPGREMLKIFFDYRSKTSILDDFEFYDKRQVEMRKDGISPIVTASTGIMPFNTNNTLNNFPLNGVDNQNDDSDN